MVAPPNLEEGQSTTRPPRFNGEYYGWWKTRMHDVIMIEDYELWNDIEDGRFVPTRIVKIGEPEAPLLSKRRGRVIHISFDGQRRIDRKKIEKNYRAKEILVCGIDPDEYNRISACQTGKEIWGFLQIAHEKNTRVKYSKKGESIQEMHIRFTAITNELYCLGEVIPTHKQGLKEGKGSDTCHKCGKFGHYIKNCQMHKLEYARQVDGKEKGKDQAPVRLSKKTEANKVVNQVLGAYWVDSSSDSDELEQEGDTSMMVMEDEVSAFHLLFALMDGSDNKEEKFVTLLDINENLKDYSLNKMRSLASVLINSLNDLARDKKNLKKSLEKCEEEVIKMSVQATELTNEKRILKEELGKYEEEEQEEVVELNVQIASIKPPATLLLVKMPTKKRVDEISKRNLKGKSEGSRIQFQLEEELTHAKAELVASLNRNSTLEEELIRMNTELEKALKWTGPSQAMTNLANQESSIKGGLGYNIQEDGSSILASH
ncbi:uncharacterized protein LOC124898124 [Capsicum annuum]|uniref:uncharacterized protein LOC124898124 n=1 Tax=Capsicum annuum TaxID=4072 RepID=UPI001FB0BF08|nr:uncharacterized protein LOC124898124 [Capsicum annuum]